MAVEVKVPDIGDFKDVPVIEIHVKPGDTIKADDPLVTLESDKATMDVPADRDGTVEAVLVKLGDRVGEGVAVVTLKGAAADAPVTPPPSVIAQQEPKPEAVVKPAPAAPAPAAAAAAAEAGLVHASPSVRRLARELEVDLAKVKGTGDLFGLAILGLGSVAVTVSLVPVLHRDRLLALFTAMSRTHPVAVLGATAVIRLAYGNWVNSLTGGDVAVRVARVEIEDNLRMFVPEAPVNNLQTALYGAGIASVVAVVTAIGWIRTRPRWTWWQSECCQRRAG